ncbi:MAG: hypothetical protein NC548_34805 [Lachnospiraceae bacterium]|nr:hypothetical protein [Lachnospiraceae bacterium]
MNEFGFREEFKNYMLNAMPLGKLASGGSVINCRCPECGDSKKNSKSRHMYISLPTIKDPPLYFCHLCNSGGIVSYRKLIDWGVQDADIATKLYTHNLTTVGSSRYRKLGTGRIFSIMNNYIKDDDLTRTKMIYINNRLGQNLTPNDFLKLKIVLNLNDLLDSNNITKLSRQYNIVQDLDRAFVGFLSLDNGFVTMRKLDDQMVYESVNRRYVNYRIFDKEDTSERFYVVPQAVDLLQPGRIKLHIAEGVFDILSIYLNLRRGEPGIYSTVCGSNYSSIISYFMIEKCIPNLEIHLYPDNDQSDYKMNWIVKNYDPMRLPIYIHRNISPREKDFGVPLDRIKEVVKKSNIWV